jgi:hypothetical protein
LSGDPAGHIEALIEIERPIKCLQHATAQAASEAEISNAIERAVLEVRDYYRDRLPRRSPARAWRFPGP